MNGVAMAAAERWFTKTFRDANPEKVEAVMEMVQTTPLHGYLPLAPPYATWICAKPFEA